MQPWKNLDTPAHYTIYAFAVNDKHKYTYVGVLAKDDKTTRVYTVKGYKKNTFIDLNKEQDLLIKSGCIILPYTTQRGARVNIVYLSLGSPLGTLKTNGTANFNGKTFPHTEELKFYTDLQEEPARSNQEYVNHVNEILIQEIDWDLKVSSCKKFEELRENTEVTILGIKDIVHRNKTRYILSLENVQGFYVSNDWLEKELESGNFDLNQRIRIKIDRLKATPSKHMERLVFCVYVILEIYIVAVTSY